MFYQQPLSLEVERRHLIARRGASLLSTAILTAIFLLLLITPQSGLGLVENKQRLEQSSELLPGETPCYCSPDNATVVCNSTSIPPLQQTALVPDNAQFLYISSNRISYDKIHDGNFSNRLVNLTELILHECGVSEILPASFRPLKALRNFELAESPRPVTLRDDAFAGAQLDLVFLHRLGGIFTTDNTFRQASIRTLAMVLVNLSEIPLLGHEGLGESMMSLILSQNKISQVKSWSFARLSQLKRIYLDGNDLEDIMPHAFSGVDLDLLDLSGNPKLRLHRSSFTGARIAKLLLNNCGLGHVGLGDALGGLGESIVELELADNQIRRIDATTFGLLSRLRTLVLSNNSGLDVGPLTFASNPSLSLLEIQRSPGLTFQRGAFCKSTGIEFLLLSSSCANVVDFVDFERPLLPLFAKPPASRPGSLRRLDVTFCGIKSIAKTQFWKLALAGLDELRLAGNLITCNNPAMIQLVNRFKAKLPDLCADIKRYNNIELPTSRSDFWLNDTWVEAMLAAECYGFDPAVDASYVRLVEPPRLEDPTPPNRPGYDIRGEQGDAGSASNAGSSSVLSVTSPPSAVSWSLLNIILRPIVIVMVLLVTVVISQSMHLPTWISFFN